MSSDHSVLVKKRNFSNTEAISSAEKNLTITAILNDKWFCWEIETS